MFSYFTWSESQSKWNVTVFEVAAKSRVSGFVTLTRPQAECHLGLLPFLPQSTSVLSKEEKVIKLKG